jgi:hypothetical protein
MQKNESVSETNKADSKFNFAFFNRFFLRRKAEAEDCETGIIAGWFKCSPRHVQKYAKMNGVPHKISHGLKTYIWNEGDIKGFADWFFRNTEKIERNPEPEADEEKRPKELFDSKDIVMELYGGYLSKEEQKSKMRGVQYWAKKNNVPYKHQFGRKYYIFTQELKEKCKESGRKTAKNSYSGFQKPNPPTNKKLVPSESR